MLYGKKIVVFLPALNEEEGIGKVLEEMPSYVDRVVVGDNGSTDKTASIAQRRGAKVFLERERGKGRVFASFLKKNYFAGNDVVVMLDSDGSYDPREMRSLLRLVAKGNHIAMGDRFSGKWEKGAMNRVKETGNSLLSIAAKALYGTNVRDLCTGYWAFNGKCLRELEIKANGFELEAEIFSKAARERAKIGFAPITYSNRLGKRKLRVSDGAIIFARLIKNRFS